MLNHLDIDGSKKIKNLTKLFKFAKNISQNKTCLNCYNKQSAAMDEEMCVKWLSEALGKQWVKLPMHNTCSDWNNPNITLTFCINT